MPGKGTTDAMFGFKNVNGKIQGRSKRTLLCICGPRESLREELWYCIRKSEIVEMYVQLV